MFFCIYVLITIQKDLFVNLCVLFGILNHFYSLVFLLYVNLKGPIQDILYDLVYP